MQICQDERPLVAYVLVSDHDRRQGIGTRLIEAALMRWPDLDGGKPVSEAGERLLQRVERNLSCQHFK